MKRLARLALTVAVVFLLAGCGVHGASSALPRSALFGGVESHVPPDNENAAGRDLLYAAGDHRVNIYTYPQGKKVNHIHRRHGITPEAECADRNGNVYVVAYFFLTSGNTFIDEYAHGGTKPIRGLFDYGFGVPDTSCSVDPVSGDLAVTGANAYVKIWQPGSSSGEIQRVPTGTRPSGCAYDDRGNLFVVVFKRPRYRFIWSLLKLPKGSSTFVHISLPRTHIRTGGSLQWDGKYLAYGNFRNKIFRLAIDGTKARVAQTVRLDEAVHVPSFWIQGKTIVGGGYVWNYPAGGKPIETIGTGPSSGVAVSVPPSR